MTKESRLPLWDDQAMARRAWGWHQSVTLFSGRDDVSVPQVDLVARMAVAAVEKGWDDEELMSAAVAAEAEVRTSLVDAFREEAGARRRGER